MGHELGWVKSLVRTGWVGWISVSMVWLVVDMCAGWAGVSDG